MSQNNIVEVLQGNPVIPVVTFNNLSEVDSVAERLQLQGIKCIEVTLRTRVAISCIEYLKERYGNVIKIGVGTVIQPHQVKMVEDLNVDFIVSPGLSDKLAEAFIESKLPFLPGVSTPSEIIAAIEYGFDVLKFFPAHLFGGINALKAYGQLFPGLKFCPTGGVTESNHKDFLQLDNVIAVGGSWIIK